MRYRTLLFAAVAIACLTLIPAGEVRADSFDYYTYQFGGNTFTWQLPSSPTVIPDSGLDFTFTDVSVTEENVGTFVGTMDFWSANCDGGMDFYVGNFDYIINMTGPQLYAGSEDSPTLLTGTFTSFSNYGNGFDAIQGGYLESTTNVPEPSTVSLLGLALGLGLAAQLVGKKIRFHTLV